MPHEGSSRESGFSLFSLHQAGRRGTLPPGYLLAFIENQRKIHRAAEDWLREGIVGGELPNRETEPLNAATTDRLETGSERRG